MSATDTDAISIPPSSTTNEDAIPRKHGFTQPWEWAQIISWLLIVLSFTAWWPLYATQWELRSSLILSALFLILSGITISLYFAAGLTQTADKGLFYEVLLAPTNTMETQVPPGKIYCPYCLAWVSSSCKHCACCDKCIRGFDHHCMWLGTCIGERNYRTFMALTVSALLLVATQVTVSLIFIVRSYQNNFVLSEGSWIRNVTLYQVFLFVHLMIETVSLYALGKLTLFHIYLKATNHSTYSWIMNQREARIDENVYRRRSTVGIVERCMTSCYRCYV